MTRIAIAWVLLASSASFGATISSTVLFPFDGGADCAELSKKISESAYHSLFWSAVNFADVDAKKPITDVKQATQVAWSARARYFIMGSVKRANGKLLVTGDVYLSSTGKSIGSFKVSEDEKSLDALNKSLVKQIQGALPKDTFKKIIPPNEKVGGTGRRLNDGFEDEWNTPPVLQLDAGGFPPLRDKRVQVNSENWHRDTVSSNSPYPPSRQEINNWVKGTGSTYGMFQFIGATPGGAEPFDLSTGIPSPPDISNFNRPDKYYGGINDLSDRLYGRWDPSSWTNAILTPVNTPAVQKLQNNPMPQPPRPTPRNSTPSR